MDALRTSNEARRTIERAEAIARELGHARVTGAHLMTALVETSAAARRALGAQAPLEAISARLNEALGDTYRGPTVDRAGSSEDGPRPRGVPASAEVERGAEASEILDGALEEAEVSGALLVEPAHVFLAATADDSHSAYALLEAIGIDVERARRSVADDARDEGAGQLD